MRKSFVVVFFLVMLSGCAATSPSVNEEYVFTPTTHKGLVVVSTRLVDECTPSLRMIDRHAELNLVFRGPAPGNRVGYFIMRNPLAAADFTNPEGYFYIHELAAGHYDFTYFNRFVEKNYNGSIRKPMGFDVKAGKVQYLGEVTLHIDKCKSLEEKQTGSLTVRDQRRRDGKLFDERMKKLSSRSFIYSPIR